MTAVFSVEALDQAAGDIRCLEAGRALHAAGRVTRVEPASFGVNGCVEDDGVEHEVWVGVRHWMLVGECDCPDTDPQVSSEQHLAAVAAGRAESAGLCAHAVAVAVAAIGQGLPWATPPVEPRPIADRGPRTTPPPPLDITGVFPELAALARPTVRLHPRADEPGFRDSSLGGPLLWPAAEAWPVCTQPHHSWEQIPMPPQITSWDQAMAWAHASRVGLTRHGDGPIYAVVGRSRPPDVPSPMIGVLQLYARDVPGLPFPDGTDCFQLLWCPNEHPGLWPMRPVAFWRRAATVTEVRDNPPEPRFDDESFAGRYQPLPCLLHPEPVTEYPDSSDLPGKLRERVERWDNLTAGLYREVLSTAPGTKAGGYPGWIQEPRWPVCGCGRRMAHLLTIDSDEFGNRMRWIPLEDRDEASFAEERYEASFTQARPAISRDTLAAHGIRLGDIGSLYLFTCTTCAHRPLDGKMQC